MRVFITHRARTTTGRLRLAAAMLIGAGLVFAPSPARAGSIFDDDYTPPKRVEPTPTPSPAPTPANPSDTPTPAPQVRPSDVASPAPANVVAAPHRAVPDRASRAKCRKLFEEVYGKELKDHAPDARRKLAQTLLDEAAKTDAGSADRFVLLSGALQAAEEGQSLTVCFDAAKQLADGYDVDELGTEADAVTKAYAGKPSPALGSSEAVNALGELAGRVIEDDNISMVPQLESALHRASQVAVDTGSKIDLKELTRNVAAYRESRQKIAPAIEKLKTSPDDPAANLAVGSFLCFHRGVWSKGLPLLAKSEDAVLKEVATLELSAPTGADAKINLADRWFAAASKLPMPDRPKATQHVGDLYRIAEMGSTGLQRLAIEKKLAQIPQEPGPRHINLLGMFDPATNIVQGEWRIENGELLGEPAAAGRVYFSYEPPEEYDYRICFTVVRFDGDALCEMCCCKGHQFMCIIGAANNTVTGFEKINGAPVLNNTTARHKDHWLVNGQHYTSVIKVRKTGVEVYLDGRLITSQKTDYSDMSLNQDWGFPQKNVLGIGDWKDELKFDVVEIVEIGGQGRRLPSTGSH